MTTGVALQAQSPAAADGQKGGTALDPMNALSPVSGIVNGLLGPVEKLLSHGPAYALMGIGGVLVLGTLLFETGVLSDQTTQMTSGEAIAVMIVGAVLMVVSVAAVLVADFRVGRNLQGMTAAIAQAQTQIALAGITETAAIVHTSQQAVHDSAHAATQPPTSNMMWSNPGTVQPTPPGT